MNNSILSKHLSRAMTILSLILGIYSHANESDSLQKVLEGPNIGDTAHAAAYSRLCVIFSTRDFQKSFEYGEKGLELSKNLDNRFWFGSVNNGLGIAHMYQGYYDQSEEYFEIAIKNFEMAQNKRGISLVLNNLGYIKSNKGNYDQAMDYYLKSMKIAEEISDLELKAQCVGNIGIVYYHQGKFEETFDYFSQALELLKLVGNDKGIANNLNNIGVVLKELGRFEEAIVYHNESIKIYKELVNDEGLARNLNNLGVVFEKLGKNEKATALYAESLEARRRLGDRVGIATCYFNMASISFKSRDYKKSEELNLLALKTAEEISAKEEIKVTSLALSNVYEKMNNYSKALDYHKQYTAIKDSLFNESKIKEIGKLEAKFEFERQVEQKKRTEDALKSQIQEEKQRRDMLQYSGIFVVFLGLLAFIFMSGKFALNERIAEGLIFFTFLIFFEFCLVVLDPFIDNISNGEPAFKLAINAALAALIFPLHSFFEITIKKRLKMRR